MYQKYISSIISTINTYTSANAMEYFGELENPNEGKFLKGSLPVVYIDFIEDDTSKPRTIDIELALYIVHISYSKNQKIRTNIKKEIHDLLKEIYKSLAFKTVEDSQPIQLRKLKKIYDASTAGGYVTIYKKDISITIPNPLIGEDL